jgi:hypothetical protein
MPKERTSNMGKKEAPEIVDITLVGAGPTG